MNKGKKIDFSLLSKYRSLLMGFAILGIVFCHLDTAQKHHEISGTHLATVFHLFTVGVDIFMLLSGMGLYYSYSKNKTAYGTYIRRRASKLLPKYFIVACITGILSMLVLRKNDIIRFIEDLFFISWPKYGSTKYWFILAIFLFYLVFPLVYKMFEGNCKQGLLKLVCFIMAFWCITAIPDKMFSKYRSFRIAIERFPIFVTGVYCGKLSKENKKLTIYIAIILSVIGFLSTGLQLFSSSYEHWVKEAHHVYYFTRGLFAIAIILTIIMLFETIDKLSHSAFHCLNTFFSYFGGITLEIYLLHQSYLILFDYPYKPISYIICAAVLPLTTACIWHAIQSKIQRRIST